MKSKQIMFFASRSDLESIIQLMETTFSIQYFEMGLFDEKPSSAKPSILKIPGFCLPKFGDSNKDLRFIILPIHETLIIRNVSQLSGGIKYAVDQLANPISAGIQFGGVVREGVLLAGTCGIVDSNDFSNNIFKFFSSKLKKEFKKIGAFYVGKIAEEKLMSGWRLVTNENSPKGYDLQVS